MTRTPTTTHPSAVGSVAPRRTSSAAIRHPTSSATIAAPLGTAHRARASTATARPWAAITSLASTAVTFASPTSARQTATMEKRATTTASAAATAVAKASACLRTTHTWARLAKCAMTTASVAALAARATRASQSLDSAAAAPTEAIASVEIATRATALLGIRPRVRPATTEANARPGSAPTGAGRIGGDTAGRQKGRRVASLDRRTAPDRPWIGARDRSPAAPTCARRSSQQSAATANTPAPTHRTVTLATVGCTMAIRCSAPSSPESPTGAPRTSTRQVVPCATTTTCALLANALTGGAQTTAVSAGRSSASTAERLVEAPNIVWETVPALLVPTHNHYPAPMITVLVRVAANCIWTKPGMRCSNAWLRSGTSRSSNTSVVPWS
jgi:hypothetical protein